MDTTVSTLETSDLTETVYMSGSPDHNALSKNVSNRHILHEKLGFSNFTYTATKSNSKIPMIRFTESTKTNYGFYPKADGRIIVLDIDVHPNGVEVDVQIDFFSRFFGVNLRETFSVITQSGGIHCYITIPDDKSFEEISEFPPANLSVYSDFFGKIMGEEVIIDADLRSPLSRGFIVAPGSSVEEHYGDTSNMKKRIYSSYFVANDKFGFSPRGFDAPVKSVSEDGFQRMIQLSNLRLDKKMGRKKRTPKQIKEASLAREKNSEAIPESSNGKSNNSLDLKQLTSLNKELEKRKFPTYHARRAFVKSVLHCCYSDKVIIEACVDLSINKDTARDGFITNRELKTDIERFIPEDSFHSKYCGAKISRRPRVESSSSEPFVLEDFIKENKRKITERDLARNKDHRRVEPRVLDISLIVKDLLSTSRRKGSQQFGDALKVVNYFLQPLSNVGAKILVLARAAISERLDLSESRASQAMRLLREKGVIEVHTKQKTGMAATYVVPSRYTHSYLTKTLRIAWGFNGVEERNDEEKFYANVYLDRETYTFREVFTEKEAKTNFNFVSKSIRKMNEAIPEGTDSSYGAGAALSYLKSEAKKRGVTVISGSETVVIETETGEVISPDPSSITPSDSDSPVITPSSPTFVNSSSNVSSKVVFFEYSHGFLKSESSKIFPCRPPP